MVQSQRVKALRLDFLAFSLCSLFNLRLQEKA
jgi:hypothetical protein